MAVKKIEMPEEILVNMLKSLPEDELLDLFWKTIIEVDTSVLSSEEQEELKGADKEFKQGKTIKWQSLR